MGKHNHKKLEIWKESLAFLPHIYSISEKFPHHEKYNMTSQIRRAGLSILTNIAEGAGRNSDKQFINFLNYSKGSVSEVETILIASNALQYITDEELIKFSQTTDMLERKIQAFINYLN